VRDVEEQKLRMKDSLAKWNAMRDRIDACDRGPEVGDEYVFAETAGDGILWLVAMLHIDDPSMLYCLPVDMGGMVGTWDVEINESSDCGSGAVRCGCGVWLSADFVTASGLRSGFLEPRYVSKCCRLLSAMVTGDENKVQHLQEVDCDPDRDEWIETVTTAAERLERCSRLRSLIVTQR